MELYERIDNCYDLQKHYVIRDGYIFTSIDAPANIFDAIVIRYPAEADCSSPKVGFSSRTLEEHLQVIRKHGIKKALIIADNIEFLPEIPEIEFLEIIPSKTAKNGFDYSPLYKMPNIIMLDCNTTYGDREKRVTAIDYAGFRKLQKLYVEGEGHLHYQCLSNLQELTMSGQCDVDFLQFSLPNLKSLTLLQCATRSFSGLEHFLKLQQLELWYMRRLVDISALSKTSASLRYLYIHHASKIASFDCLYDLVKMEYLSLEGSNKLESLAFLKNMKGLLHFYNTMPVLDGDLRPCLSIPHVYIKRKKYYNLKSKDLPDARIPPFTLL